MDSFEHEQRKCFRWRSRSVLSIIGLAVIIGLVATAVAHRLDDRVPIAEAATDDYRTATWNMQGSNTSEQDKWNSVVQPLANANHIVALQEAGQVPSSAVPIATPITAWGGQAQSYGWGGTRTRPGSYIYYLQTDPNGNRVNLAIVTDRPADEVIVLPPPTGYSRAILGIRIGNDLFFTIHANSGNRGADRVAIVQAIEAHVQTNHPGADWQTLGDWNHAPDWNPPGGATIVAGGSPTQNSGGELDYMVMARAVAFVVYVLAIFWSDHRPVEFRKR